MGNLIPGDGNDNWKTQLRGNDGRWINMYGPVSFDYTPSGGGPAKKGKGTFQGVTSPGRANIFVKDDPELEVGMYEVQSQYVRGVKAFIPTSGGSAKPNTEVEPEQTELKNEITGDEAMQIVRNAGAEYARSQGRFAMARTYNDVKGGLRAQYAQLLEGIKQDNPELLKNKFIINEDGTGRTGDVETDDDFWGALRALEAGTSSRWVSPEDIDPLAKEVNRRYAEKFLGLKKDGLITFYRNAINEKENPADAAAGYISLDRKMAWDYNSQKSGTSEVNKGRYIVKAKPDEVLGILGLSGATDEFGVVVSPEVTSLPGRFERVGNLEKQTIDTAPWVSMELLDKEPRSLGGSPFRFLAPMANFDYYALDSNPFGEGTGWSSFYEANGLELGAMPNKYNELYGEGAWEKDFGDGSPRASSFADLFIEFTDEQGNKKWGLNGLDLKNLNSSFNTDILNTAEPGDSFDRNIKVLSTMQELMGKPFFVNKGHDQSDPRIPEKPAEVAKAPEPETVDASKVEESAASDVPPYRFENSSTGWNYEDEHVVGTNPENSPTDEEVDSIVDYIGKGYTQMNAAARGEGTGDSSFSEEEIAASIENLTNLIDRNPPLGTTALVYRGVYDSADIKWSELEVGSEFVDMGFVSTSPNAATAGSFGTIQLEIELGEDTKAIDVSRTLDGTKAPPIEQEVILQRGTRFEVVAKTENGFRLRVVGSAEPEPLSAPKPEIEPETEAVPENVEAPKVEDVSSDTRITLDSMQPNDDVNGADFWYADSPASLKEEIAAELARDMQDAGVADYEFEEVFQALYNADVNTWAEPVWTTPKKATEISLMSVDSDGNIFQRILSDVILGSSLPDGNKKSYLNKKLSAAEADELVSELNDMDESGTVGYLGFSKGKDQAVKNAVASGLVKTWAISSNDEDVMSHALQQTAKEIFGLQDAAEWKSKTRPDFAKEVDYIKTVNGNVLQTFLQIQYNNTQTHLANNNIKEVVVYRGLTGSQGLATGTGEVSLRPMSSWSTDINIATRFAQDSLTQKGTILRMVVQVEDIISTPFTGVGCLEEQEMVIKGGVRKVDYQEAAYVAETGGFD